MADDLGRETIPGVAGASRCPHPTRLLTPICSHKRGKARQVDGAAPSVQQSGDQDAGDADPGIDGFLVEVERLLERSLSFFPASLGYWSMKPCPAAHYEIARIWIGRIFLFDLTAYIFHELHIERSRETAGYRVVSFHQLTAVSVEAVRPDVSASF